MTKYKNIEKYMGELVKYLLVLLFLGCTPKIVTPVDVQDSKDNFEVVKLFRKDNCTLYRFYDSGNKHYFSDCGEVETNWSESCGKNCIRHRQERIRGK
jgi:hypothetical protein